MVGQVIARCKLLGVKDAQYLPILLRNHRIGRTSRNVGRQATTHTPFAVFQGGALGPFARHIRFAINRVPRSYCNFDSCLRALDGRGVRIRR